MKNGVLKKRENIRKSRRKYLSEENSAVESNESGSCVALWL
jgi:hypothetical protein